MSTIMAECEMTIVERQKARLVESVKSMVAAIEKGERIDEAHPEYRNLKIVLALGEA